MTVIFDILKAIFIGIIQGVTEWLPVSSTGHMILFDEFIKLNISTEFKEMFFVVVQLGSMLAVLIYFFNYLNPFTKKKSEVERKNTYSLWLKVIIAIIPSCFVGLFLDNWFEKYFYHYVPVAIALIVFGIAFIVIERLKKNQKPEIETTMDINYRTALFIGIFQIFALFPGTSRSGSTILGAMLLGLSRTAAAEFSFFMSLPTIAGASGLKALKFVLSGGISRIGTSELITLIVGTLVAFIVSLVTIKFLMGFVRKHSFEAFGWYRIVLGVILILYFIIF